MSKFLIKRCQRRWRIRLKPWGDSKVSPYWSKADIKSFKPAFGHLSGKRSNTHWVCFIK